MLGQDHEDIVNEVRRLVVSFNYERRASVFDDHFVGFIIEKNMSGLISPVYMEVSDRADGYILLPDGYCGFPLEVGKMPKGKWDYMIDIDEKPVRVLRISFERYLTLMNSRGTVIETQFLEYLVENGPFQLGAYGD